MAYFVYVLRCQDHSLYTGIATDWQRRWEEHQSRQGAKYTRSHPVERIERVWQAADKIAACKLEYRIKALPKSHKEQLIAHPAILGTLMGDKIDPAAYEPII